MGCKAPRYLADVVYDYWTVAVEPYWPSIRAVLEDDVAFRAGELTRGGMATMVAGMHPSLHMRDDYIVTDKTCKNPAETYLDGTGMLMVPSVFGVAVHRLVHDAGQRRRTCIYPARGVGKLWSRETRSLARPGSAVGAARAQPGRGLAGTRPSRVHD